jgi:GTPase SAR1 family protein
MTVQFVDGHFVDSYYPTIENTFSKMIKWKNQDFATEIIDTAGQVREVFLRLRSREGGSPTSAQG